jgi:hypothetical protein
MSDPDNTADSYVQNQISQQTKRREIQNEIDKVHRLPGGRNNPVHSKYPASDASTPIHREMAKSSADFIAAQVKGDRGRANAARVTFHEQKARAGKAPKGIEEPCVTADCGRANVAPVKCETSGGCRPMGGSTKVGRSRD